MTLLRFSLLLCTLLAGAAFGQPAPPLPTSPTGAVHDPAAPRPVDAPAVAKALRDQGPVGFVPGNIRVVAEAGAKATQALTQLRSPTGARAYVDSRVVGRKL